MAGETIRPINAATSTRRSSPGPRINRSPEVVVVIGADRIVPIVASTPATHHTSVDMPRTFTAASRAASGFDAAARTATPYFVRLRKKASAAVRSGTMTRISRCSLRTRTPATTQTWSSGVGYEVMYFGCGSTPCPKRSSCAAPIVATSTITRGASNRRRTTTRSTSAPSRPPMATHAANATQ